MGRRAATFAAAVACAATLGAGLPGAAAGWVIQPTPNVANVDDNDLVSVSCPGATERILIDRLRDGRWNVQRAPNPPPDYTMNFLQAVSCATPEGCAVAGTAEDSNIGKSVTLVLHRDHGSWAVQPTPNPASGNPSLTGLSCRPAGGCTAVGSNILPGDAGTLTTLAEHG